jgi:hypothetical protein
MTLSRVDVDMDTEIIIDADKVTIRTPLNKDTEFRKLVLDKVSWILKKPERV